jgi:carboxyl-terminal processing protease
MAAGPRFLLALALPGLVQSACPPALLPAQSAARLPAQSRDLSLETFDAAWRIIHQTHFDTTFNGVNWQALGDSLRPRAAGASRDTVRALIRRMLGRLGQSHFSLIPQEESDATPAGQGDRRGTPGFEVRLVGGRVMVTAVDPGGPAGETGIRPGYLLAAVDSFRVDSVVARALSRPGPYSAGVRAWGAVRNLVQGPTGSEAAFEFLDEADRPRRVTLRRWQEPGQTVKFGDMPAFTARFHAREVAANGARVGVIWFNNWLIPLLRQVDSAVHVFRGADGMVLDLRGNTGGMVAMVSGVAGHFTERRDTLGLFRTRTNRLAIIANPRRTLPDGTTVKPFGGPVAILTDEVSASATEVFAGGMQAMGRVRVFGATSLGGVLPAVWDRLPNGDVLYHAIADFRTTAGLALEGRGVVPDEPVLPTRLDLLAGRDPVLDATLAWIARHRSGQTK